MNHESFAPGREEGSKEQCYPVDERVKPTQRNNVSKILIFIGRDNHAVNFKNLSYEHF